MVKKIVRMGLPLAVALGIASPIWNTGLAQEKGTDQRSKKKRTDKSKGKGGGEKKKNEQRKGQ